MGLELWLGPRERRSRCRNGRGSAIADTVGFTNPVAFTVVFTKSYADTITRRYNSTKRDNHFAGDRYESFDEHVGLC
jgi:hypothetical protein